MVNKTKIDKKKILFLCTGNSCRSQMAEGWMKHFHSDSFIAYSAGVQKHGINPYAVKVMAEVGVDISAHESQLMSSFENVNFDLVITVCDNARESCPVFLTKGKISHHSFPDPPALAMDIKDEEKKYEPYRHVRDLIRKYVEELPRLI